MDKSTTLSVKNFIIRNMSVETMIPEKIIEAVIAHQFSSVLKIMDVGNSVELSGFGKFVFKKRRARTKLIYWSEQISEYMLMSQDESLPIEERDRLIEAIKYIEENVKIYKAKVENGD